MRLSLALAVTHHIRIDRHTIKQLGSLILSLTLTLMTTGPEVWKQTQGNVTHFVASLGTCGTVTGTGTYLKQRNPQVTIVAAHPPEGHDIPGVRSREQAKVTQLYLSLDSNYSPR